MCYTNVTLLLPPYPSFHGCLHTVTFSSLCFKQKKKKKSMAKPEIQDNWCRSAFETVASWGGGGWGKLADSNNRSLDSLPLLSTRETPWTGWREPSKEPGNARGTAAGAAGGKAETTSVAQRGRKAAQGDLINTSEHLMGGAEEKGARLFSAAVREWTSGTGHWQEYKKFQLKIKPGFTVKETEHWME